MVVLLGKSGSGKSTIVNELVKKYGYQNIKITTSRTKRKNEDENAYNFISENEFENLISKDAFVTYLKTPIGYYGIKISDCINTDNKHIIILSPSSFREFKSHMADLDITSIYLWCDRATLLIETIERGDNIEEAYRRNLHDEGHFEGIEKEVDYIVYNYKHLTPFNEMAKLIDSTIKTLPQNNKIGFYYNE